MISLLSYIFLTFYVRFCCIYYSLLLACPAYYKEKREFLCQIILDVHAEIILGTDMTDVTGATVIISGLGDNYVIII